MALYHAGKHGTPLCGSRGNGNRYNVVCLPAKEWNESHPENRCQKCIAKIETMKAKKGA